MFSKSSAADLLFVWKGQLERIPGTDLSFENSVVSVVIGLSHQSTSLQELGYVQTYVNMKYMWAYFHTRLQTYLERFAEWWLNEHCRRAHMSFRSVFLNIKLHLSFLHKNNNNLPSGQPVRFLLSFWTEVANSPLQSCRSLPSLSV